MRPENVVKKMETEKRPPCASHGNRRNGRGHGKLCAIQHIGVVSEPGGSERGECVRGAILSRSSPQGWAT